MLSTLSSGLVVVPKAHRLHVPVFLVDVFAGGSDGYQGVADEPGLGRSPRHKEF